MPEMNENRKIQKITKLLEKGGTMLAMHHECGAPMFRYQGKNLCPVCDFQEEREIKLKSEVTPGIPVQEVAGETLSKKPQVEYDYIKKTIKNKIQSIVLNLEEETDLQRVKDEMECIELGIRILNLLED